MLDTVTVIPITLAYTFIGLLVTILSFIAIYVCHKVYTTIFDRMPLVKIIAKMPKQKLRTISVKKDQQGGLLHQQQHQLHQHQITEKFVEKYASKGLQIVDVKRENRKVA